MTRFCREREEREKERERERRERKGERERNKDRRRRRRERDYTHHPQIAPITGPEAGGERECVCRDSKRRYDRNVVFERETFSKA